MFFSNKIKKVFFWISLSLSLLFSNGYPENYFDQVIEINLSDLSPLLNAS